MARNVDIQIAGSKVTFVSAGPKTLVVTTDPEVLEVIKHQADAVFYTPAHDESVNQLSFNSEDAPIGGYNTLKPDEKKLASFEHIVDFGRDLERNYPTHELLKPAYETAIQARSQYARARPLNPKFSERGEDPRVEAERIAGMVEGYLHDVGAPLDSQHRAGLVDVIAKGKGLGL